MTFWVWASDLVHALFCGAHDEHFESKEEAEKRRVVKGNLELYKITIEKEQSQ